MNRSILIVICDFLLVSLLAFSTVDINKVADDGAPPALKTDPAQNQAETRQDLGNVMRLALEQERIQREALLGELAKTRETAGKQQTMLTERDKQIESFQTEIRSREQQAAKLLEQQQSLERQVHDAKSNIQSLNQKLETGAREASVSKEKIAALDAEARKRAEKAAALEQELAMLNKKNQAVLAEKQQLANQLQLAESEKRHAIEQAASMREQVKAEREEKAKLAESFKTLATTSGQLEKEIRENRPLAPNTLYEEFLANRVQARFSAVRDGILGLDSGKTRETQTALVTDGTNIFALCHVHDTPLAFKNPGANWESLTGAFFHKSASTPVRSISFHRLDPRIVLMPITQAEAKTLNCKTYRICQTPYKFQEAMLAGTREDYYGECQFQIDPAAPGYLKMDNNTIKGMFGKFNPSRGDLVFSKKGELLGIMANNTYCAMLRDFNVLSTLQLGLDVRNQNIGDTLAHYYSLVASLPFKLQ